MLKTKDVREGQIVMESILKDLDLLCKENDLSYWLMYGTLIGAARHKGFIPWDDDIDIGMLREDYNRLKEIFKKNKIQEKYELLTKENSKNYPYSFYKVVSKENFCDYNGTEDNKGIFLDIFPFDLYSEEAEKYLEKLCFNRKNIEELLKKRKKEKSYFKRRIITLKNGRYIFSDLDERVSFYFYFKEIFPLKKLFFETQEYYVPNDYDSCLKKQYGNYMELPPIEKRNSHHPTGYFYIKK